jgi:hypothetical protein
MQRCAAHLASKTDVEESFLAGQKVLECRDGMTITWSVSNVQRAANTNVKLSDQA